MKKYDSYTNAELNIEMKKLEENYEISKIKVLKLIDEMKSMDEAYVTIKKEIEKRKGGLFK
jgi:hypothetical protein